jgi:aspartyl protease family protein
MGRAWLWLLLLTGLVGFLAALVRVLSDETRLPRNWSEIASAGALIVLAAALALRLRRGTLTQNLRSAALWTLLAAALALGYAYRAPLSDAADQLAAAAGLGHPLASPAHDVVVRQGAGGAFVLTGRVNGRPVRFVVDTASSDTVLSPDAARQLGVDLDKLKFADTAETAHGMGQGAPFVAQRLEVGSIGFTNFPVVINREPMAESLLGLSFLNRLDSFEVRDRKLILKRPAPTH